MGVRGWLRDRLTTPMTSSPSLLDLLSDQHASLDLPELANIDQADKSGHGQYLG